MAEPLAIDVAGAQAALDAAGGMPDIAAPAPGEPFSFAPPASNTPPAPDSAVPPVEPDPLATTTEPIAPETAEDLFTQIDDAALSPAELQMKRSLQADYTKKMQEIAPLRKLGAELGVDQPDQVRAALEVYTQLKDPSNWPTIHAELSRYMQDYGMSPADADKAAAQQVMEFAPDTPTDPDYGFDPAEVDPAVAPLMQQMQQLANQVKSLKGDIGAREQQEAQQAQWNAAAARLTEQEAKIRKARPDWSDDDIVDCYNLMGQDGNLIAAAQRFESMIGRRVGAYIAGKTGTLEGVPAPLPGAATIAAPAPKGPLTISEGHAAAMQYAAALDSQG